MKKDEIIYATVTNIVAYGAFVRSGNYEGLIHISEISSHYVTKITDYFNVGDRVKVKVVSVDEEKKKLKLSYKAVNKSRGKRCAVPQYAIGFTPLRDALPYFVLEAEKKNEDAS